MTGNLDTDTGTLTGRKPCDDEGRDWSDAFISWGMPRIAGKHKNLEEARKDHTLEPSEGAPPCQHLDFGFLVSRSVREYIFVV